MRRPTGMRMHICHWPGCRRPVPQTMWGCKSHWYSLPQEIRQAIENAWYRQGSKEWVAAHEEALEWIRGIPERIKAMGVKGTGIKEAGDVAPDTKSG